MKNVLFYFSGSGNSLKIARDFAKKSPDYEIVPMVTAMKEDKVYDLANIGLIFPVHFWGVPPIVKQFVSRLRVKGDPYIFAISNAGGTGAAVMLQLKRELAKAGLKLASGFCLSMPTSYIRWFDAVAEEQRIRVFNNQIRETRKIVEQVASKTDYLFTGSPYTNWIFSGIMYSLYIPQFKSMDKDFRTNEKCNGCGNCAKVCPVENIRLENERPVWLHNCTQCFACIQWCHLDAIEIKNKTLNRTRYHHPEIRLKEMILRKPAG